jgi:hypothetical protein
MVSGSVDGLTEEQREQIRMQFAMLMRVRENFWLQHENGVMDDATWGLYKQSLLIFLNGEMLKQSWEEAEASGFFHPGFLADINQALAGQKLE